MHFARNYTETAFPQNVLITKLGEITVFRETTLMQSFISKVTYLGMPGNCSKNLFKIGNFHTEKNISGRMYQKFYHYFMKNTHDGVLLLVKLQDKAYSFTKNKTSAWELH